MTAPHARYTQRLPTICLAVFGAAIVLPYLLLPILPGDDYPNHLARLAILGAPPASPLRSSFVPHWALMPDLGLDLIYMALKPIASPETVLHLALAGSFVVMLASVAAIQRTLFGRIGLAAVFAPLFVAGLPVMMGYASFVVSCAVLMVCVWLYLTWRDRLTPWRVAAIAAIAACVWLCHIAGFGVLMVFIGASQCWEDFRRWRLTALLRRGTVVIAIALPGILMTVLAEKSTSTGAIYWKPGFLLRTLVAPLITNGKPTDLLLALAVVALLFIAGRAGGWRVAPPARAPLCLLGLLVVLLPWGIDPAVDIGSRIAVPTTLLLLATSSIGSRLRPSATWPIMVPLCLVIVARDVSFLHYARAEAITVDAFRTVIRDMKPGATIMVGTDKRRAADCSLAQTPLQPLGSHSHLAAYATIDKGAWEPGIFAAKGRQPIRSAVAFEPGELPTMLAPSLDALVAGHPVDPDDRPLMLTGWPAHFDYLLLMGLGCRANPMPDLLRPYAAGSDFVIFKTK